MDTKPVTEDGGGLASISSLLNRKTSISDEEKTMDASSPVKKRETWSRKIDFLLACVGFSVGLGNVWRFPFLCYKNGGGAFLIPYFISVLLAGVPLFFLEVALGQFMSEGGISAWKICPLFQGIGYASAIIVFFLNCEYNIILTWAFYYLFSSFTLTLPWSTCENEWNTVNCSVFHRNATAMNASAENMFSFTNMTANSTYIDDISSNVIDMSSLSINIADSLVSTNSSSNFTIDASLDGNTGVIQQYTDPVTEYWERKVLALSPGIDSPGPVKWDLALCLLLAWIIVYFCIWKGIRTSGKVMYFTATSPYILMFALLIRGVTLEGSMQGIKLYLLPDWERLTDAKVWVDAGTQIFFSYSISLGTLTALGSYNKFHHNSFRDSLIFACTNSFTSFLAGFVIFSVLGFMAHRQGVDVKDVAESGPGLAFIVYPEAISQMPAAPLWATLFFLMLILLGLDSQFVGVEGFITAVVDIYPDFLRRGYNREILIGVVSIICYFIGLSMITEGGMYVFQLFDYYSASRIVLVVAFFECIVISYVYGANRFMKNMQTMYGFKMTPVIKWMWRIITPAFTFIIFLLGIVTYSEVTYERKNHEYHFPKWAIGMGWTIACSSVVFIPIIFVWRIVHADGTIYQRFLFLIQPAFNTVQRLRSKGISSDDERTYSESPQKQPANEREGLPMLPNGKFFVESNI